MCLCHTRNNKEPNDGSKAVIYLLLGYTLLCIIVYAGMEYLN